ncbi:ARM repeat-containing protein [Hygrophoropsis aurantiaca]|uniref:ARM repeat-containing protein n=1 Tax=Hygrophoropsis aurantiaca TaxID=72124 RepID=A0ACB8AGQ4_9AGAM|nr:ARM repeat-containing protein [Hygrophoropsis aurantiaca]
MEEDITTEKKLYATFERFDEFMSMQHSLLCVDLSIDPTAEEDATEFLCFQKLCGILGEYQEQSYLLDPYLESLVIPAAESLRTHARARTSQSAGFSSRSRLGRLADLLYHFIKFRGRKTIVRFFPHEIADLSIALEFMQLPDDSIHKTSQWSIRYVLLLWLSLICRIPFDLEQFDEHDCLGHTADTIESIAKSHLSKAGLEREGAAELLSRLYTRKDSKQRFVTFLHWSIENLRQSSDIFISIAVLQVLCDYVSLGSSEETETAIGEFLDISRLIEHSSVLSSNTLVRKYRTKLLSRIALRLIPAQVRNSRITVRSLSGGNTDAPETPKEEEIDVPEEVETILEDLFKCLQDRDTVVRWSAAKGIARLAERLPIDFSNQVLETILGLFSIHSIAGATVYDMPSIAEATWHGACLASAEMARRGLVLRESLAELLDWLSKALYFDIRKGAHSIGSNVRDAAAYVFWALARAQDPSALACHATKLAQSLAAVSLYDREIHIRRAASAAFQEHVGRMGLFPHGIDVLRKTDFYAVSIRRNAFVVAAPQVAEHVEYRSALLDHVISVTLRHWDADMRQLGAHSLREICRVDLYTLGPACIPRLAQLLKSFDIVDIQGGLLALTELAEEYRRNDNPEDRDILFGIFSNLVLIPQDVVIAPRNEIVHSSACYLIASSLTLKVIELQEKSPVPHWRKIIEAGLRHRNTSVQEAAAVSMEAMSRHVDCSRDLTSLIQELRKGSAVVQQSLARVLGVLDYNAHAHGVTQALRCLLDSVSPDSVTKMANVEARRNCYQALPKILANVVPRLSEHLSSSTVCAIFDALDRGLDDYTMDERGDVGSWIRMACIQGLTSVVSSLFAVASNLSNFAEYLPPTRYHSAIARILRQGVERLDNVRQLSGECFLRLLTLPLPTVDGGESWRIQGESLMKELFMSKSVDEETNWGVGDWLFPKAMAMLEVEDYRKPVLTGIILSVGTRTGSTQRPASTSITEYAKNLPLESTGDRYSLLGLTNDLLDLVKTQLASNTIVVPVFQTFNLLLESDILECLQTSQDGLTQLDTLISVSSKNISRLKNVQRIQEAMKIAVNLLAFPSRSIAKSCVDRLAGFLAHSFPKIRASTAEYLYVVLQSKDFSWENDEIEDLLLETEWSSMDIQDANTVATRLVDIISSELDVSS